MKTLFIIRHAKSSWDDPSQSDIDRPLNERGKRDAPVMASRLVNKKLEIELFISSPAKRAKKTAMIFAEAFGVKEKKIELVESLYEAAPEAFFKVVEHLSDDYNSAAIFSHNPGITGFVNMLTDQLVPNMPTCAVFAVKAAIKNWSEFRSAKKELLLFDYPKSD